MMNKENTNGIPAWHLKNARTLYLLTLLSFQTLMAGMSCYASSGTEGAAFLDIPVGAEPAAMGGAYSALANDAYAATLNPGGLGFLDSTQVAGQHLAYLESVHYEYLSFGVPLQTPAESALGGSMQYLGTGDIAGTDKNGDSTGNYTSYYSAYNLSFGHAFTREWSLGVTGKWIHAKIDDVTANAYAADIGSMYRPTDKLTLAAVVANAGTPLTFLNQKDSLPLAFHLGGAYRLRSEWLLSAEAVAPKTGLASAHFGAEWQPVPMLSLRTGYRTDTVKELGPLAGYTLGMGIHFYGQEFSYAWVPLGDLGNTHYFSLILRLGETGKAKRNLIQLQDNKRHRSVHNYSDDSDADYQQLMEILTQENTHMAESNPTQPAGRATQ